MRTDLFDVTGPLPRGLTVLEASAGTGKTYTIASLAARYVAEGLPLPRLLLVTFTRMATGELRERVRDRLAAAEQAVIRAGAGVVPHDDEVLALLADAPPEELALRRERLTAALADFDAATIATTHGFCQHILTGLGVAGDVARDVSFVEDLSDLVDEVVDDLYLRKFHTGGSQQLSRGDALRIGRAVVGNPLAPVEPRMATADSIWDLRRRLALKVRKEVDRRKRRENVIGYDDLLTRLASTLADPERGPAACERLRSRYHVALVDEFQDTDPIQWDILRRAFGSGARSTLVLIGDPKQAIYAFRGADVYAYLDAARVASTRSTLGVNWRSDQGLLDALDAAFGGARLGHEQIAYRRVEAAPANREPRLVDAPAGAPLRLRVLHRADGLVMLTPKGYAQLPTTRRLVVQDLAADMVRLLSSAATVITRRPDGTEVGREPIRPGHIAVLVRTNRLAAQVRDALDAVGIPAVINGAGSVFATPVAREWLILMEALERPSAAPRARAATLTHFLGWTAQELVVADDEELEVVHATLHRWAAVLRRHGVATLLEQVMAEQRLGERVLGIVDGERLLTDLRHVGQLLHLEATAEQLGTSALTAWLRQRVAEAADDTGSEERSRRLESDEEAVQVLTVHRSKGLEFPIVYFPDLWDPAPTAKSSDAIPIYHDPAHDDQRSIDVGGKGMASFVEHERLATLEQRGEDLRLAYVALTRARHQAVVWWAGTWDSRHSSLGRLLFGRDDEGNVALELAKPPEDDVVIDTLEALSEQVPGCIAIERAERGSPARWAGEAVPPTALVIRGFDRGLDAQWRRASYSAITFAAHEAVVSSEPEDAGHTDEELPQLPAGSIGQLSLDEDALRAVPSLFGSMPGGTLVGTFVHAVLEDADFAAPDLAAELAAAIDRQQLRRPTVLGPRADVVAGLIAALTTPLGPTVAGIRLVDVERRDRLDELGFELPLVGGDHPTGEITVAAIARVLRDHLDPGDPLAAYPERLADPALASTLRGYLTGSLDLVLRVGGRGPDARFAVIDHKTNWLAPEGEALSAWHYRPDALVDAMEAAHYPLQATLYLVALHRYLRWRLPGYDPERNLAGALYLFVRGMTGPSNPTVDGRPCGVFAWQPPAAMVVAMSDLLETGWRRR